MSLKTDNETKIEPIYCNEDSAMEQNFITEKYLIVVEGYSLLSNIGFIKIEIWAGTSSIKLYNAL